LVEEISSGDLEDEDVGGAGSLVGVEEENEGAFAVEDIGGAVGSFHEGLEKENAGADELDDGEVGGARVGGLDAESFPHLHEGWRRRMPG